MYCKYGSYKRGRSRLEREEESLERMEGEGEALLFESSANTGYIYDHKRGYSHRWDSGKPKLPKSEGGSTVRRKSYIQKLWQMAMKKQGMSNHGKIYPKRANRAPVIETQDKENQARPEKQNWKK